MSRTGALLGSSKLTLSFAYHEANLDVGLASSVVQTSPDDCASDRRSPGITGYFWVHAVTAKLF